MYNLKDGLYQPVFFIVYSSFYIIIISYFKEKPNLRSAAKVRRINI